MIVRYRLLKAHRINGVLHQPGYEFEIPEQTGDWLVEQEFAVRTSVPEAPPSVATPEPQRPQFTAITRPKRCCGW